MKIQKNGGKEFTPCPEFEGRAVCVDVTPLELVQTMNGPKEQFRVVFEVDTLREDGSPFAVWSRRFTPSCHEKSAFFAFMKKWLGREMTESEWENFDTESLLGRPAKIIVIHETGKNGDEVYANIESIRPHKDGEPLKPSGKFVRKQNRENNGQSYRKTDASRTSTASTAALASAPEGGDDDAPQVPEWSKCKVHVGKHKGHELRELAPEAVTALMEHWLPTVIAPGAKQTADDKRLILALQAFDEAQRPVEAVAAQADDVPMNY